MNELDEASLTLFEGDPDAVRTFFATCQANGEIRVAEGRDFWTLEDWRLWLNAGRAAFGPEPTALFGQLALVEAMLNSGCTAAQIAAEVQARKARVEAEDRRQRDAAARADAESRDRARAAAIGAEREKAIIREQARLEAKEHVGTAPRRRAS